MDVYELIRLYPHLYHVAQADSWPYIRSYGLLTTRQLVDACNVSADARADVLDQLRPRSIELSHPAMGRVVIRDQAPLREQFLLECLTDITVVEWLQILNNRVFFWLHRDKLRRFLGAFNYRARPHDVLVVDTASLLAAHCENVELSAINSGATLYPNAPQRGPDTFKRVEDYPYTERRRGRPLSEAIVELAVPNGVSDMADHVVQVERWHGPVMLGMVHL